MIQRTQQEFLKDTDKKGKDRKWKERKRQSVKLADMFKTCFISDMTELGYSPDDVSEIADMYSQYCDSTWLRKADATGRCGETLEFVRTEDGRLKLYQAWFCKDRLCPMCNWRRAMKFSIQIAQILNVMKERKVTGRPIFITFTMKNVTADSIGRSFSDFALSFNRLMKYKAVKDNCIGAIRTSEITYNKRLDNYNTHIHCLLWMCPGYFKGAAYLSQAKWTELWKRAARLDYTPVVNVKAVKPKKPTEHDPTGLFGAVLEVSKYPIKPDAFNELIDSRIWGDDKLARAGRIKALEKGMKYKRLISFFGIFKEIRAELKQDDIEDGDLINEGAEDSTDNIITVERYEYDRVAKDYRFMGENSFQDTNKGGKKHAC